MFELLLLTLPLAPPTTLQSPGASPKGIVVLAVHMPGPAHRAGLQPGDTLLEWSRPGSSAGGVFRSPLDFQEMERTQLPRGAVAVRGQREGRPLGVVIPHEAAEAGIDLRSALSATLQELYERGAALVADKKVAEGTALWREAARQAGDAAGSAPASCWFLASVGRASLQSGAIEAGRAAYDEAVACLGDDPRVVVVHEDQALAEPPEAARERLEALVRARDGGPDGIALAWALSRLATHHYDQGRLDDAIAVQRRALAACEAATPGGPAVARALIWLGVYVGLRGDTEAAEELLRRALRVAEATPEAESTLLEALTHLGGALWARGDLAACETLWRRVLERNLALAPGSASTARALLNLGAVMSLRGDLDGAGDHAQRALSLLEKEPDSTLYAAALNNLGAIAGDRGDYGAAREAFARVSAILEKRRPMTYVAVQALLNEGRAALLMGDRGGAKPILEEALMRCEKMGMQRMMPDALSNLAELSAGQGDWNAAEDYYGRALALVERRKPGSTDAAKILRGLGTVHRARQRLDQADQFFARAVEALETQRGSVGTSEDARALFTSRFFGIYHDRIALLVERGRAAEAFHVLERYRARSLLALMAERDLILEDEIPRELERSRRRVDADYERAKAGLEDLDPVAHRTKFEQQVVRLRELKDSQSEIAERIRRASPRLANLRHPTPLDARGVIDTLDPETALLTYSVGQDATVCFVATSAGGLETFTIQLGEERLRERVEAFRRQAERNAPSPEFFSEAGALYDLLLMPAEGRLLSARRLLVSPDGPLHKLPFAALRRKGRYLVESARIVFVPSGTVHAQLARPRSEVASPAELVAFADPLRPGGDGTALPASRDEVRSIARLFPRAEVHLGAAATEQRVKELSRSARYVHLACHGLIDDRFPLDSALVLSRPEGDGTGDNGVLHAWEVFERVRLDADLVTLSACRSADGKALAGEGLVGLTRAFQYAGARAVLASLWRLGDRSSARFMRRFYGLLRDEIPPSEALRRTQVAAIRSGHHAARWAAFQLYGAEARSQDTKTLRVSAPAGR